MGREDFFGEDPDSYNIGPGYEDDDTWGAGDGTGRPGINIAANAICFWIGQQGQSKSVGEIAEVFKMPIEAVAKAAKSHTWLFLAADAGPMKDWLVDQDGA
jgi:hypothetical protein